MCLELRQADPVVASRHLLCLLESELMERFPFQLIGEISDAEIKQVTACSINVFVAKNTSSIVSIVLLIIRMNQAFFRDDKVRFSSFATTRDPCIS